ncbi:MAG: TIGR03747 family integrating conjugative element membrane protein [Proteobacteria bacterium]|nr:TIGR03747 family integrating conjugative element membrane protein [Pseudomonadota bacterium]
MSENTTTRTPPSDAPKGLVYTLIMLPFQVFGILVGALLLSILVEWVGMKLFWPEKSWHHAQKMLDEELEQLSGQFRRGILVSNPGIGAQGIVLKAREALFAQSGFLEWVEEAQARAATPPRSRTFRDNLAVAHVYFQDMIVAAAYTSLVFLTRLLVLVLTLPLFLLAAFVGFVDGLVRRDIRRFSADSESGFIYHRARAALWPLAVLPWGLYLALPVTVHPLLILLPAAILLGVAVNIAAGSFKKYL